MLLHHVVDGTITPEQLVEGELTTLAGTTLTVTKVGDTFFVDGNPVGAGVEATNGYVYVMSDVLVPALGTIVDVAVTFKDAGFGTLVDAGHRGRVWSTRSSGEGPFTVFAPVDAAFEALDPATLDAALADPTGLLTTVLTYHVVPGKITTDQFADGGKLTTVAGRGPHHHARRERQLADQRQPDRRAEHPGDQRRHPRHGCGAAAAVARLIRRVARRVGSLLQGDDVVDDRSARRRRARCSPASAPWCPRHVGGRVGDGAHQVSRDRP